MTDVDERAGAAGAVDRVSWGRRLLWGASLFVGVLIATIIVSATVPRWWAQRVGDQVDGSITQGTALGLVYGFVFTFLPVLVLVLVLRWRTTWKTVLATLVVGVLLALPNLMTLSIVLGQGNAAHAGERILDVEAPAFRGGSLAGAIAALVLVGFVLYLLVSRDRARSSASRAHSGAAAPPDETG